MKNFSEERHALHIYQNTPERFLLFYTVSDFLVFFTIVCTCARKHGVRVLGICPMYDHLHILVLANSRKEVFEFVRDYTRQYSKELNKSIGRTGTVFTPIFGCAVKTGDKAIRTACSYHYNNPGEKKLCRRAEEYRWAFLAYAISDHPFSEKIVLNKSSRPMRRAIKMLDYFRSLDKPLTHGLLNRLFSELNNDEKNQLTDRIISKYNCIDYESLISFYGSYDKMCLAFASNQGKEYDIEEVFEPGTHLVYPTLSATIHKQFGYGEVKDVFKLSLTDQESLAYSLIRMTGAQRWQIRKFFRWHQNA